MKIFNRFEQIRIIFFRTVHSGCQPQFGDVCDLGEFRQFIVPPFCVVAKPGRTVRHPKRKVVSQVRLG
jgi:hypothetical protein